MSNKSTVTQIPPSLPPQPPNAIPHCILPSAPSPQLITTLAWIEGFNTWNVDLIAAQLSSDSYEHHILPTSLGQPVKGKEEFVKWFKEIGGVVKEFQVTIHEVIESPGKMVLHASSRATSATSHPYRNEYMIVLTFSNSSSSPGTPPKIIAVKEFVDSYFVKTFFPEERERIRLRGLAGGAEAGEGTR